MTSEKDKADVLCALLEEHQYEEDEFLPKELLLYNRALREAQDIIRATLSNKEHGET